MTSEHIHDVLIIGSGAAGLTLALQLPTHLSVAVLSKGQLTSGSTWLAQGGIAAVLDAGDTTQAHYADTMIAGADLSRQQAVEYTVTQGTRSIQWLIEQGVPFTREDSQLHLTQEGGHSHRRIIHAADATGRAVQETLIQQAQSASNITLFENCIAVDLITREKLRLANNRCVGAYVLDSGSGEVQLFRAGQVVLATGGASKAYLYTSNSDGASGDGIAMAWRSGARVANMEFNQFHPTCLYHPQAKSFLISEAVRGEGGHLLLPDGERFMLRFDERGELAPRDIVARAIDHEMKRLGCDCLYLDISHKPSDFIKGHFPTIYTKCLELGIDITRQPIPIVPAAHYTCGGIVTDIRGRSDIPGLYAIGETAFTGLHGANRLASNSLLECLVFASAVATDIAASQTISPDSSISVPAWDSSQVTDSDEDVIISHNWEELRRFMWDYVGIVRTNKRLQRAKHRVDLLQQEITEYYSNYRVTRDLLELRNLALVSDLIIRSAMQRTESRGLHYTLDYPDLAPEARDTILTPVNYEWPDQVH
ncbi:L-aspartate oxidase [Marinobacterium aestuarii]|uniref:L-aspartate oxidase n=1 Tax=Marinobacterium aestuarii TaxID=1821621 RepID=A0A1A9F1L6_9GAMM|nr:L-aspartate oxidase [Marinobacterium aestuarii]ANG64067.1 L-aspartate oxidase [Marinobacterium aestuarii]